MNMSKESKNETNPNTNYKGGLYKETRVKKKAPNARINFSLRTLFYEYKFSYEASSVC